ncbi:MAG: phage holin family protein [Parcubacteria group bacterium]|nr:phage holin family protein [Parcubacteria group bacterium]
MKSILGCILAGCIGLALAMLFVPSVIIQGNTIEVIKVIIMAGGVLGLFNFFLKPIIKLITLPLRMLTLGLFGLVINMAIIWFIDVIFTPELTMIGIMPLFWTALLVWGTNLIFAKKRLGSNRRDNDD